jgi:hypothetical protein
MKEKNFKKGIEQSHGDNLCQNPHGILPDKQIVSSGVIIHDDPADDDHEYTGKDDQAGKGEEFYIRNRIPVLRSKRLINVDE